MADEDPAPELAADDPIAARRRGTADAFTGRAAQLAVVAEILRRQCNAAVPEVDLGIDVIAFKEGRPEVARIQVKACAVPREYKRGGGFSAKFSIPLRQLTEFDEPSPLFYVFAVFRESHWSEFLVVSRARLIEYYTHESGLGSENRRTGELDVSFSFRRQVFCGSWDLSDCRNAWETLPPFRLTAPSGRVTPSS